MQFVKVEFEVIPALAVYHLHQVQEQLPKGSCTDMGGYFLKPSW